MFPLWQESGRFWLKIYWVPKKWPDWISAKNLQSLQVTWVKNNGPREVNLQIKIPFQASAFPLTRSNFHFSVFFHELHLISVVFSPMRSIFHELHRELLSPSPLPVAFLRKEAYNSTGRRLRPGESTEKESYRYPNEPISQVGKRKLIFKNALVGDMLLSRRVMVIPKFNQFVEA